jgi:hypothetical protein
MITSPDFGNMQDNAIALHLAMEEIEAGNVARGCALLLQLREHICMTQEAKSVQWLLPRLEEVLQCFYDTEALFKQHNTTISAGLK